jgi:hypothetical protein
VANSGNIVEYCKKERRPIQKDWARLLVSVLSVDDTVAHQVVAGIDIISDGEMSKPSYTGPYTLDDLPVTRIIDIAFNSRQKRAHPARRSSGACRGICSTATAALRTVRTTRAREAGGGRMCSLLTLS